MEALRKRHIAAIRVLTGGGRPPRLEYEVSTEPHSGRPLGQRFTHVYLERGSALTDSARARARIASFYASNITDEKGRISKFVRQELGANVWSTALGGPTTTVHKFIRNAELRDFLDLITIICRGICGDDYHQKLMAEGQPLPYSARRLVDFTNRVFREENLIYEVDHFGGVHTYIDAEFQRSRVSTLAVLDRKDLDAVKYAFEQCYVALDCVPPDTLTACRRMFEAAEIAVKALFPDKRITVLAANEVDRYVRSRALERFASDTYARNNANELVNGLRAWVNGLHSYRHGQHAEEPVAPPLALAIALISSGATYLRFLIETLEPSSAL